jgi:DNA-binding NarL/FixJ family response regulator
MANIRVLCVDDHRLIREGIIRILSLHKDVTIVAEGSTGEEAVEQFVKHRPDVTLMDLQLPRMSGFEALTKIREVSPEARIVVLTMNDLDESIHRALQAGAIGYVLKDSVPEDLIYVIREAHAGRRAIPRAIDARLAARAAQPSMTAREMQILELLAKGMRNKEIGGKLSISEETVRVHLKSIFLKLNVHDRTAALTEALSRGIVQLRGRDKTI